MAEELGAGERIVWTGRSHAKALLPAALAFIVLATATGAALAALPELAAVPDHAQGAVKVIVWSVAGLFFGLGCVVPFARWRALSYTVTNHRVVVRRGVLRSSRQSLPLARVDKTSLARSGSDLAFGAGTITLWSAGQPFTLAHVPAAKQVHAEIDDLLHAALERPAAEPSPAPPTPADAAAAPAKNAKRTGAQRLQPAPVSGRDPDDVTRLLA